MAALAQDDAEPRQVCPRQPAHAGALGLEMHREEHGQIVEQGRQEGPDGHREVADIEELGHDEGGGAHDRRHDLAAGRRHGLDRPREGRAVADLLHQRDREDAGGHHVRDRAARYRAEQAAGHHRHLGRPAGRRAGERQGEVHEQLACLGSLDEGAEQDEQDDVAGADRQRDAEDALGRHVGLVEQHLRVRPGEQERVGHEGERGDRQGVAEHAPRRLEDEHDEGGAEHPVERPEVVDGREPGDEIFVLDEDVGNRRDGRGQEQPVDRARRFAALAAPSGVDQEQQHHREQQMRRAEDQRLGDPDQGDPQVIDGKSDRHGGR